MCDHKVDDLELVTAGAVVETQSGPIIIIMNQCARMINGKTMHSSGQMEHHKAVVKDQAHAITNVVPHLEPHEGYRTPLCFINGLPYMKMRVLTDKELETLPRVTITSDVPWDPRVLNLIPPDKWFSDQPKCLELIEGSTFNEHGGHKESLPSAPEEDTEKVLDAEDTVDDPNHTRGNDSPLEVSRATIKAHLHNLVHDEIVPEYRIFRVGDTCTRLTSTIAAHAQTHTRTRPRIALHPLQSLRNQASDAHPETTLHQRHTSQRRNACVESHLNPPLSQTPQLRQWTATLWVKAGTSFSTIKTRPGHTTIIPPR